MAHDGFQLYGEELGDRIDAATLPQARNYRHCPKCQAPRCVWVFYCGTCRRIGGKHFHRECGACGATWDERSAAPHAIVPVSAYGVVADGDG